MNDLVPAVEISAVDEDVMDTSDHQCVLDMIQSYSQATLAITERMLKFAHESEMAGIKTLMLLDDQGEQLNRANEGLDLVENDLDSVEYNLNKLEFGIFSCCCCCCSSSKNEKKSSNSLFSCWHLFKKKCLTCRKVNSCSSLSRSKSQSFSIKSKSQSHSTKDNNSKTSNSIKALQEVYNSENEKKITQNLEQLAYSLGNLNNLAQNVSNELVNQNKHIKDIARHANITVNHVQDADKYGRRLISK